MNNSDIFKALNFAVKNPNFKREDLVKIIGSEETVNYILGHGNPNNRYFKYFGIASDKKWVASIEANSLLESLKQTKLNEKSLRITQRTLLITVFFAAMTILINLVGMELNLLDATILIIVFIFVGFFITLDWKSL